ncbi:MAG: hypothetical protein ABIS86_17225 [Streptosporangiaceae bacterium]
MAWPDLTGEELGAKFDELVCGVSQRELGAVLAEHTVLLDVLPEVPKDPHNLERGRQLAEVFAKVTSMTTRTELLQATASSKPP